MTHSPKPAEIWERFEVARSDTLTLVAPNPVSSIKLLTDAKEWTAVQTTSITQKTLSGVIDLVERQAATLVDAIAVAKLAWTAYCAASSTPRISSSSPSCRSGTSRSSPRTHGRHRNFQSSEALKHTRATQSRS